MQHAFGRSGQLNDETWPCVPCMQTGALLTSVGEGKMYVAFVSLPGQSGGGVIGADIQDIYGGLLRILGEDSTIWELTIRIIFLIGLLVTNVQFLWWPYMGVGIPNVLTAHLFMCSTQSPLVSFEPAFDHGHDHCKQLTGAQNHDWGEIYSQWVNRWRSDRHNTLQLGKEIIDFHPLPVYYEWYTQQYGIHLRLSDRVAGEEVGANEHSSNRKNQLDLSSKSHLMSSSFRYYYH
ncbi:hypothetical protein AHAS_Ahas18G0143900 [Arachis hypogaea]